MTKRTWRDGYVPGKAKKTIHLSDEVARALELRSTHERVSQAEIVENALRGYLEMKTSWKNLALFDTDNQDVTDSEQIIEALREFKNEGSIDGVFFRRIGASHEDEDDASTWGPASPDHVDWTGFPGALTWQVIEDGGGG